MSHPDSESENPYRHTALEISSLDVARLAWQKTRKDLELLHLAAITWYSLFYLYLDWQIPVNVNRGLLISILFVKYSPTILSWYQTNKVDRCMSDLASHDLEIEYNARLAYRSILASVSSLTVGSNFIVHIITLGILCSAFFEETLTNKNVLWAMLSDLVMLLILSSRFAVKGLKLNKVGQVLSYETLRATTGVRVVNENYISAQCPDSIDSPLHPNSEASSVDKKEIKG